MKFDPKNIETPQACWGIHLIFTFLLAIGLAAYDGLEHTYPILIGYMMIGWLIPLALWPYVKRVVSRPVSPSRSAINTFLPPVVAMVLGPMFFLLGVFMSPPDRIVVNGLVIPPSDPRYAHDELISRILFCSIGLLASVGGYFWFRFLRRRKNDK
jgi:hypothetical protein